MKRCTALVAVLVLLVLPHPLPGQVKAPWFGTWSLNLSKSGQTAQPPRYKRVTSRIEPLGDGLKVTYDMVGTRGGVTHWEWTGKFDAKDYPVQGIDTALTNAYRKIDDKSYEIVVKIEGAIAAVSRVTVSPDGNTLNVATEEHLAGGGTANTTAVYERQPESRR
jgi:hypothetical protein